MSDFIRIIKGQLPIRFICFPYMNMRQEQEHTAYLASNEPKRLRTLKKQYMGKRCFIIGNGASLRTDDLNLLKDEITIASNRIYNVFPNTLWRPTIYMAEDPDGLSEMLPNILDQNISIIVIPFSISDRINESQNVFYGFWSNGKFIVNRYNDRTSHISEDISHHFSCGYTVTFSAIQLAIYMGVKEIYLLGVDFDYAWVTGKYGGKKHISNVQTYFDGKERKGSYLNYYSTMHAYGEARRYADNHDIKIYNATRGGKLEVFDKVEFDDIFGGGGGVKPV